METGTDIVTFMSKSMGALKALDPKAFTRMVAREAYDLIVAGADAGAAEKPKRRGRPKKGRELLGPLSDPTMKEHVVDAPVETPADVCPECNQDIEYTETVAIETDEGEEEEDADAEVSLRRPKTRAERAATKELPPCPPEIEDLELYRDDPSLRRHLPELIPEWRKAYPGVDVAAEIKRAHSWELSNPQLRKTSRGRSRFLNAWCSRAQDGQSSRRYGRASAPPKPVPNFDLPSGTDETKKQAEEAM